MNDNMRNNSANMEPSRMELGLVAVIAYDGLSLFEYGCANAKTDHHPVGTCKMGSDETAVVDARLRVRGLVGLRIADASIMPTITSGNTNSPTVMIAEKAARMILAEMRGI